jgi:hypothetical protein
MNLNLKLFLISVVAGAGLLPLSPVVAGINVNEVDNSVLCKGSKSCSWLQSACGKEGGKYTPAGEYGKCNFPAVGKINDFTAPKPPYSGSKPATKPTGTKPQN